MSWILAFRPDAVHLTATCSPEGFIPPSRPTPPVSLFAISSRFPPSNLRHFNCLPFTRYRVHLSAVLRLWKGACSLQFYGLVLICAAKIVHSLGVFSPSHGRPPIESPRSNATSCSLPPFVAKILGTLCEQSTRCFSWSKILILLLFHFTAALPPLLSFLPEDAREFPACRGRNPRDCSLP